ncbi:hypothetical protein [Anaerosalibacter massiliensis]|uniref:Uncharacterized protein n=1 Tax=Anaerosalibacter massiliensis TaxID=1347392 RepID=A0A9X2S7D6_9FIRM|nr:hypothetical protein [Anaerosalibacter massiliensis]MCR2044642.1 hypothetical protein [Anaerosalibacter massiliensis]
MNFLLNIICGTEFLVTVLPKFIMIIYLAIPLTYGFGSIRGILICINTLLPISLERITLICVTFLRNIFRFLYTEES